MSERGLIYLVRHGEAAATWGQDADPPLSRQGQCEARDAAATLLAGGGPLELVSSPLLRARQTAAALATLLAQEPRIDQRFREIPSPVPLEQRQHWLRAFMRQRWDEQEAPIIDWRDGMMEAVHALPANTVVFTHFLVINTVVAQLQGSNDILHFWPANASITRISREGEALKVLELGASMRSRVN